MFFLVSARRWPKLSTPFQNSSQLQNFMPGWIAAVAKWKSSETGKINSQYWNCTRLYTKEISFICDHVMYVYRGVPAVSTGLLSLQGRKIPELRSWLVLQLGENLTVLLGWFLASLLFATADHKFWSNLLVMDIIVHLTWKGRTLLPDQLHCTAELESLFIARVSRTHC
jgi:hypothetical protein